MLDTKKMRACAPLLQEPGDKVVCECLDEIERLREVLQTIRLASCDYTTGTRSGLAAIHKIATDALPPN